MTGAGGGDELDLIAHEECSLDLDAVGAQICHDDFDAALLDGAQTPGRDSQAHEALFALQPESMRMQIRQEAAALAIVRMGHRVTGFRAFARDLADSRHDLDLVLDAEKSRALYQPGIGEAISLEERFTRRGAAFVRHVLRTKSLSMRGYPHDLTQ